MHALCWMFLPKLRFLRGKLTLLNPWNPWNLSFRHVLFHEKNSFSDIRRTRILPNMVAALTIFGEMLVRLMGVWGSSPLKILKSQMFSDWILKHFQALIQHNDTSTVMFIFKLYQTSVVLEKGRTPPPSPLDLPLQLMTLIKTIYTKPKDKCWPSCRISAWKVCETRRHPPSSQTLLHWRF